MVAGKDEPAGTSFLGKERAICTKFQEMILNCFLLFTFALLQRVRKGLSSLPLRRTLRQQGHTSVTNSLPSFTENKKHSLERIRQ